MGATRTSHSHSGWRCLSDATMRDDARGVERMCLPVVSSSREQELTGANALPNSSKRHKQGQYDETYPSFHRCKDVSEENLSTLAVLATPPTEQIGYVHRKFFEILKSYPSKFYFSFMFLSFSKFHLSFHAAQCSVDDISLFLQKCLCSS